MPADPKAARRNKLLIGGLAVIAVAMVGMSYAAVPLYRKFCQVTGYGGTTQRAAQAADRTLDRVIEIRFNTDVNFALPWAFRPDERSVQLKVGQTGIATFHAQNLSGQTIAGTALYNVTPDKAGKYFVKMQCFCFSQQVLRAHESAELPVAFYVDPSIVKDPDLDDVSVITLSYTFFKAQSQDFDKAVEAESEGKPAAKSPAPRGSDSAALAAGARVE